MCGIAGYIGDSKKPILTYQLITKLFEKSESRGVDAAGYWGIESGIHGNVLYHKEPGKASNFVKGDMWKQVAKHNPNLLLVHARGASKGMGEPYTNSNNHPFTSLDKSIGLIHNGRVDDTEYHSLKRKFFLRTDCDSEILLRIFESGEAYSGKDLRDLGEVEYPQRLAGIRDIFSFINEGHMAVAIGERKDDSRLMWLFRNRHRPLWIVDMREALGQIFFVSEPTIWEDAVYECSGVKGIARSQKLIELPTEEVWYFKISNQDGYPHSVQRFEVCKENSVPWQYDGKRFVPTRRNAQFEVITRLDDKDQIVSGNRTTAKQVEEKDTCGTELADSDMWEEFSMSSVNSKCDEMVELINHIRQTVEQLVQEQSITRHDFDEFVEDLERQRLDLEGLSSILGR